MSIREACRPAVIAPLRGLSTNAQPDRKDARWLGRYLTSSAHRPASRSGCCWYVRTTLARLYPPGGLRDRLAVGAP